MKWYIRDRTGQSGPDDPIPSHRAARLRLAELNDSARFVLVTRMSRTERRYRNAICVALGELDEADPGSAIRTLENALRIE